MVRKNIGLVHDLPLDRGRLDTPSRGNGVVSFFSAKGGAHACTFSPHRYPCASERWSSFGTKGGAHARTFPQPLSLSPAQESGELLRIKCPQKSHTSTLSHLFPASLPPLSRALSRTLSHLSPELSPELFPNTVPKPTTVHAGYLIVAFFLGV